MFSILKTGTLLFQKAHLTVTLINRQDTRNKKTKKDVEPVLGFLPKQLVECNVPVTTDKSDWGFERTNGHTLVRFSRLNENHLLPNGRDRHLILWLKTEAEITKSNVIYFNGVESALRAMNIAVTGQNIKWLKSAILRLHHTDVYWQVGTVLGGGTSCGERIIMKIKNIDFDAKGKKQSGTLHLSPMFFDSIAIPVDQAFIRKLGRSWMAIDLYSFCRKRIHANKTGRPIYIKIEEAAKQFSIADAAFKHQKESFKRAAAILSKNGFLGTPTIKDGVIVIPNVQLPPILTPQIQAAFSDLDARYG